MKKVISMLMCLLLCFSFPVTSSAETVSHNGFQPYYEKASEAKSELIINGTTATCKSTLTISGSAVACLCTSFATTVSAKNITTYSFKVSG